MPRSVNPGSISVGKGRVPKGTVADNSLRQPNRDIDPLRVHVHDPSRAHMASSIGIVDAAGCFVSDEVEGALQEICSGASAGRLNGLVAGGRFDEVVTGLPTANLTLTLESVSAGNNDTIVMVGAAALDVSGLQVTVADNAVSYIYLDCDSSSGTYQTLLTSNSAPEVESSAGIEHILFAKVTSAAGVVTQYQDGRFFVRNLDRKVQYSSRQGENVDAWSEGCFVTLQAFFLWMAEYGDGGTSEEEKGTVIIRGTHTVSSTITVPTDHLQFLGDGEAKIVGGNFAAPLIDVTGRDDISFRGIEFGLAGPITDAIRGGDGTTDLLIEDCTFLGNFGNCVGIVSAAGTASKIRMAGCYGDTFGTRGVLLTGVSDVEITGCDFKGPGVGVVGTIGISADGATANNNVRITNTLVRDCENGVRIDNSDNVKISGSSVLGVRNGIAALNLSDDLIVSETLVELEDDEGLSGISIAQCFRPAVMGCTIKNPRVNWVGEVSVPKGLEYANAPVSPDGSNPRFMGNHVQGFFNQDTSAGSGIAVVGGPANRPTGCVVQGNTLVENSLYLSYASGVASGNSILGPNPSGAAIEAAVVILEAVGLVFSENVIRCGGNTNRAIWVVSNTVVSESKSVRVSGNRISLVGVTAPESSIQVTGQVSDFEISQNHMDGFVSELVQATYAIRVSYLGGAGGGTPRAGAISGNRITRFNQGISLEGNSLEPGEFISDVEVSGNHISQVAVSQNSQVQNYAQVGAKAIGFLYSERITVRDNLLVDIGFILDNAGSDIGLVPSFPVGVVSYNSHKVVVTQNRMDGFLAKTTGSLTGGLFVNDSEPPAGPGPHTVTLQGWDVSDNLLQVEDQNGAALGRGFVFLCNNTPDLTITDVVTRQMSNIRASGNRIIVGVETLAYDLAHGIVFTTGDVAGANYYGGSFTFPEVFRNDIVNTSGAAILLDAPNATVAGASTVTLVLDLKIVENELITRVSPVGNGEAAAIKVQVGAPDLGVGSAYTASVNGLKVLRNTSLACHGYGIEFDTQQAGTGSLSVSNLHFEGNTIPQVGNNGGAITLTAALGIKVDGELLVNLQQLLIDRNNFLYQSSQGDYAIRADLGDSAVSGFSITGNKLGCSGTIVGAAGAAETSCVYVSADTSSLKTYEDVQVNENILEVSAGADYRGGFALWLQNDVSVETLSFRNNQIKCSPDAISASIRTGFYVDIAQGTAEAGNVVEGFSCSGNTVREGGLLSFKAEASVTGFHVFENMATIEYEPTLSGVQVGIVGDGSGTKSFEEVKVVGNSLYRGSAGVYFVLENYSTIERISVSGNTLTGQSEAFFDGYGVRVLSTVAPPFLDAISISGNIISGGTNSYGVVLQLGAGLRDCDVSGNKFFELDESAIRILTNTTGGADGNLVGLNVSGNLFRRCARVSGDPVFEVNSSNTSAGFCESVKIDGNQIFSCGVAAPGSDYILLDAESWSGGAQSLSISGNQLEGSVLNSMQRGISVILPETTASGISIQNNQILDFDSQGVFVQGAATRNLVFSGNSVVVRDGSTVVSPEGFSYSSGGRAGDNTSILAESVVSGNTFQDLSTPDGDNLLGIVLDMDNDGDTLLCILESCTFDGNVFRNVDSAFYTLTPDALFWNVSVSGNQIYSVGATRTSLIYVECDKNIQGLNLNDNSIQATSLTSAAGAIEVERGLASSNARNISICRNSIEFVSGSVSGNGIRYNQLVAPAGFGNLQNIDISHNSVLGVMDIGIYFSWGALPGSSTARYVTISENRVSSPLAAHASGSDYNYGFVFFTVDSVGKHLVFSNNISEVRANDRIGMYFYTGDNSTLEFFTVSGSQSSSAGNLENSVLTSWGTGTVLSGIVVGNMSTSNVLTQDDFTGTYWNSGGPWTLSTVTANNTVL